MSAGQAQSGSLSWKMYIHGVYLPVFLTLGILAAWAVPVPVVCLLAIGVGLSVLAILLRRVGRWLLPPLIIIAGAANYSLRTQSIAPNDLRTVVGEEPLEGAVRGELTDTPYQRVFGRDGKEVWRTLARIKVDAICMDEQWRTTHGEIIVTTPEVLSWEFYSGQKVQVQGVLRQPRSAVAPGTFDYRAHLRTLGIHYQLMAESTNNWQLLSTRTTLPWRARFGPWAREVLAHGLPRDRYLELLWTMALGWKTGLNAEVSEPFMRSGTMHVFAISGLHIALIAAILVASLKLFRLRRPTCAWIVIPLIWFYTGATGWQASAIRSTIMSSVIILGWCLRRPADLLNSLMFAAFIILMWDPLQLFQAGFQLSFFVVLALALLMPALDRLRERMLAPDPFLAPQFRTRAWRWFSAGAHAVMASFAVSVAAWLGSLPLIANYFHLLTPVTLLANMVVVPLSSGALACNLAALAIGWASPPVAELFNHAAWFLMVLMVKISEWAAGLPLVYHVRGFNIVEIVCFYVLVAAVFSGWVFRVEVRKWAAGATAAAVVPFAGSWWISEAQSQLTVLPLNGGSAVYVKHGEEWLIDCGDLHAAAFVTKPFLQAQGIDRLQHFVLTHGDVRHVEAAPQIHREFSAQNVYATPMRFLSRPYRIVQDHFRTNKIALKDVLDGDRIGIWQVLHPTEDTDFPRADDKTIVLFGTILNRRILLLSDLGTAGQNALLSRHPDLKADILVTGLPRESEPVANGFLEAVQPKLIVVADSEFPASERASTRLRSRLAERECDVLYTSDSGAITLSFSKNALDIRTMNKRLPPPLELLPER